MNKQLNKIAVLKYLNDFIEPRNFEDLPEHLPKESIGSAPYWNDFKRVAYWPGTEDIALYEEVLDD